MKHLPPLALSLLALALASSAHAEGAFAQLYAARPPAGSSFVRVLNPHAEPLRVKIGNGPEQTLTGNTVASSYAIVKGQTDFTVTLNGRAGPPMKVAPDSFTSLLPTASNDPAQLKALDDSAGATQDALKAGLRFYNLSSDCTAGKVGISPAGTPLFAPVAYGASAARAINPVKATLVGSCGAVNTATLDLPALQPGEHFSMFLTGSAAKPALKGQRSATDGYKP
ncbi:alginate O-acetyltransferase AlgF [Diaphorobacter aerolatus]|uniref:Alginate biosynthesis protein AlgF n=1 Tax=Diaphorobacter aerolatus TaxID=1288495 RepID=A0A7H0GPU6_9BURK|nr:alginate O-acetyltransferase AlgF [Diaphorobacter aerolatus]QNP50312.1 alginate O-acetyltransferase AlgF [Diaphorobacter aerolatus]